VCVLVILGLRTQSCTAFSNVILENGVHKDEDVVSSCGLALQHQDAGHVTKGVNVQPSLSTAGDRS